MREYITQKLRSRVSLITPVDALENESLQPLLYSLGISCHLLLSHRELDTSHSIYRQSRVLTRGNLEIDIFDSWAFYMKRVIPNSC